MSGCDRPARRPSITIGPVRLLFLSLVLAGVAGLSGCGERAADNTPDPAAEAAQAALAKARAEAEAAREAQRLGDLWTYHEAPVGNGRQLTASIFSTDFVETDGQTPGRVQLVFRDHPSWGRSSYLVLTAGDFACYDGCRVAVTVDDKPSTSMAGRRPRTDEAIAMFINDERTLWRLTEGATRLRVEFPVKVGGTRTASFEVAGLDRSKMPGWDPAGPK